MGEGNAATAATGRDDAVPVRVWDLPTRVFHWLLLVCVVLAVVTALVGGNAMIWHQRFGLTVGALVVFRVLWGLVGGRWSRFAHFVVGPGTLLRYLRGEVRDEEHRDVGHNPLGSLSVLALLGLLLAQVATGTIADDEIAFTGPLFAFVSEATSHFATSLHKTFGQYGLYLLVSLHVGAVAFYRLRKGKDLITPMVKGDKHLSPSVPASADGVPQRLLALVLFGAAAALAFWISKLGT